MKKLGNLLKIAFFLVIGATFAEQINAALDYIMGIDYVALGETISSVAKAIVDGAISAFNWIKGAVESAS